MPLQPRLHQSQHQQGTSWIVPDNPDVPNPVPHLFAPWSGHTVWDSTISITTRADRYYTLELVTAGNMLFVQDGRESQVEAGSLFFQNRRSLRVYHTGPAGFVHKRFLSFAGTLADALVESTGLASCDCIILDSPARVTRVGGLFKQANRRVAELTRESWFGLSSAIYSLLMEVSACVAPRPYPPALLKALLFMETRLDRLLTIDEIAVSAGLSVSHCHRLFAQHLKMPPVEFFQHKRTARAQALLSQTSLSIKEIAQMLGHDEVKSFCAQFRRYAGISPRAYRRGVGEVRNAELGVRSY